jgi:hypothetical protein
MAIGVAVSCVLLLSMRQNLRMHLLQHQISEMRTQRLALQRDLEERGQAIASRTEFARMAPEIATLKLGSASSGQVLALAQLPVTVVEKRTLAGTVVQYLSGIGEVRAAYPGSRPKPVSAPETENARKAEPEGIPEHGGLW